MCCAMGRWNAAAGAVWTCPRGECESGGAEPGERVRPVRPGAQVLDKWSRGESNPLRNASGAGAVGVDAHEDAHDVGWEELEALWPCLAAEQRARVLALVRQLGSR